MTDLSTGIIVCHRRAMHHESERYELARPEPLYTISELGELLGVSRATIYRLLRRGELTALRVGSRQRFTPAEVRRYLYATGPVVR